MVIQTLGLLRPFECLFLNLILGYSYRVWVSFIRMHSPAR
jgi:hypothetical protein